MGDWCVTGVCVTGCEVSCEKINCRCTHGKGIEP